MFMNLDSGVDITLLIMIFMSGSSAVSVPNVLV